MSDSQIIILLSGFNIVQFIFWSLHTHKLVNKIMSRNFAEYNQIVYPEPLQPREIIDFSSAKEEEDILNELNGMLPS